MDFKKMGENLGLDEDDFIELVELFTTTAPMDIEKLKAAYEQNDPGLAVEAAHSLKGASGNLGLTEISAIAGEAEKKSRAQEIADLMETVTVLTRKIDEIKQSL